MHLLLSFAFLLAAGSATSTLQLSPRNIQNEETVLDLLSRDLIHSNFLLQKRELLSNFQQIKSSGIAAGSQPRSPPAWTALSLRKRGNCVGKACGRPTSSGSRSSQTSPSPSRQDRQQVAAPPSAPGSRSPSPSRPSLAGQQSNPTSRPASPSPSRPSLARQVDLGASSSRDQRSRTPSPSRLQTETHRNIGADPSRLSDAASQRIVAAMAGSTRQEFPFIHKPPPRSQRSNQRQDHVDFGTRLRRSKMIPASRPDDATPRKSPLGSPRQSLEAGSRVSSGAWTVEGRLSRSGTPSSTPGNVTPSRGTPPVSGG